MSCGMAESVHVGAGQRAVDALVRLLSLERLGDDEFEGLSPQARSQRVFGGQVAGQALVAAGRTVSDDRFVHSLHSYFVRPGDPRVPIRYTVDRTRDGRSFSIRRVVAEQDKGAIFLLSASFQLEQDGVEHQTQLPEVPDPETLPALTEPWNDPSWHEGEDGQPTSGPIDVRFVDLPSWHAGTRDGRSGPFRAWMRANGKLPDDPLLHVCMLTFFSDLTLLDAVVSRHGLRADPRLVAMASLDHAMWFRRPFRADDWMLYSTESPSAAGGRGLASGRFYSRDGEQIASVVQEGMVRLR
jgi:acyl-CoA thioesterase-2